MPTHTTDPRIKKLSYSSLLTLHSCPRKFQLYKLNSVHKSTEDDIPQSVTFAYGHAVGLGIQEYITHHSLDETIWNVFLSWEVDLLQDNLRQKKSFWLALAAIERFAAMCKHGFMKDWKLASYNGKPATELSFRIKFPDGYSYVGFVDAVLQNTVTGEVMVLECKTTAATNVAAAAYKNSAQAIGYSIVLDVLYPELSSYTVQYLIDKTKQAEYDVMQFEKSYLDRALWIRSLLLDIERIKTYEEANIYPMHGESCNAFFRECEYFGICTLSTDSITEPQSPEDAQAAEDSLETDFQIQVTIEDLIKAQLQKA